jgi:NMD protein affecting ribosome stability and mRNA decay
MTESMKEMSKEWSVCMCCQCGGKYRAQGRWVLSEGGIKINYLQV